METEIIEPLKRKRKLKGISGSTLKIIAIITMLVDHVGAAILEKILYANGMGEVDFTSTNTLLLFIQENSRIYYANTLMRMIIGRIAFPIFCFLLVEGFLHTKDVKKYAIRLGIFALISEIPFDLAIFNSPFDLNHQNVFFTLLIGLLVMMGMEMADAKENIEKYVKNVIKVACVGIGLGIAEIVKADYGALGIISIVGLYFFRQSKVRQIVAGCISFIWEPTALLGFIPIGFYNGKRGLNLKYFFYGFYPVHLIVLYLIRIILKI